ncbi:MAG TPA: hypothetical protein VN663_22980 [Ramlibacter sp.]|nr:hypothetical protein [Ramlibacter sp.]
MIAAWAVLFLLICIPAGAQDPVPGRPGIGVDARGGQVIDPTENVKALSEAANKRQDDLRTAEGKYQNAMRDAETRRLNELAAQKQIFDLELARVIRANVDASSMLLATQLKEVKTDLSERTAKLEQFRWESGGQSGGRGDMLGWIVAGLMLLIALSTLALNAFKGRAP